MDLKQTSFFEFSYTLVTGKSLKNRVKKGHKRPKRAYKIGKNRQKTGEKMLFASKQLFT